MSPPGNFGICPNGDTSSTACGTSSAGPTHPISSTAPATPHAVIAARGSTPYSPPITQIAVAAQLVEAGLPRMPARVFAALLASDAGSLTSAELARQLQISPAAVSGAVRYLAQVHMLSREREPGSRRERYRVHSDQWYEALTNREAIIKRWEDALREGVTSLGATTPGGAQAGRDPRLLRVHREGRRGDDGAVADPPREDLRPLMNRRPTAHEARLTPGLAR